MSDLSFILGTLSVRMDHMEKRIDGLETRKPAVSEGVIKLFLAAIIAVATLFAPEKVLQVLKLLAGFAHQ